MGEHESGPMTDAATVVIVGAGFSGTVTAAHLLRRGRRDGRALRVLLVNRSGPVARGVAYGTRTASHVLNVPAGRMSAIADDEDHFLRFAQARDYSIVGGSFVPRALYGEYLEHLLEESERGAARGAALERLVGEVLDIEPQPEGASARVTFADGRIEYAARVVLALGNYAPADPPLADRRAFTSPRYVRDPWARGALEGVDLTQPVLLVGTGLTTVDIALDLHGRGMRAPMIAISRRGLLPLPHRASTAPPAFAHRPPDIESGPATASAYLRAVRTEVRRLAAEGVDWREVVSSLRPITPRLWHALPQAERARFLRHLRPYWEVHRHRAAPLPHATFERLRARGELRVIAGRLERIVADDAGFDVELRRRASSERESLRVAHIINCTGPQSDPRRLDDPLLASLLARGLARPDPLGLGVETSDDLALLDCAGEPSRHVVHVGPMLRSRFWEATAVPELRVHARHASDTILDALDGSPLRT